MRTTNAYRIKTSNSDFHAAGALVIGFTRLLKGWWDHYLSQNDRDYILNAKKIIVKKEGTSVHDCGSHYWKEKFILGLPTLFAEKVRQRIRNIHNGRIPYESLTYGELITFVNNEGLALCTDLKLKSQMKKEKQDSKKELGKFCS